MVDRISKDYPVNCLGCEHLRALPDKTTQCRSGPQGKARTPRHIMRHYRKMSQEARPTKPPMSHPATMQTKGSRQQVMN